ncbi:1-deoxy-D-xylulose-5-phosphate reductoisomerase [Thermodesulfobacteriota bacterium]
MKKLAILGSTGSIGTSTLKVVENFKDRYRVAALTAGNNIELIQRQIEQFNPLVAAVAGEKQAEDLRRHLGEKCNTEILWGMEGFIRASTMDEVDMVVSAMSGAAGLIPTYEAIKARKDIALANKETMVIAGEVIMDLANKYGIAILPIDSEHSAVFQSLQGHKRDDLKRIVLTASGGPFREHSISELESITPAMALNHPNWEMGRKITIDSATLMNKGLEVIEARWLFDLKPDQIDILIHPESIVHSMVEYMDGSVIAQMGIPDMITPISYALSYPEHLETNLPPLRLEEIGKLSFFEPDKSRFKCLALAVSALETGESMPAVLNGANEIAVDSFLKEKISFLRIPEVIEKTMNAHISHPVSDLDNVLEADRWAREKASEEIKKL